MSSRPAVRKLRRPMSCRMSLQARPGHSRAGSSGQAPSDYSLCERGAHRVLPHARQVGALLLHAKLRQQRSAASAEVSAPQRACSQQSGDSSTANH